MTKKQLRDLLGKIECEGFDYYFRYYASPSRFKDPQLKQLALNYCNAANDLIKYLAEEAKRLNVEIEIE